MSQAPKKTGVVKSILAKATTMLETISSIVILVMMVLTFVDVIGRYGFNKPLFGGTEIIGALLALAIFSGLGVTNARDDHITVELFEDPIRRHLSPIVYEIIVQLFSVFCMSLIAFVLAEHAYESYLNNKLTVVLEMPVYYVTAIVSLFAVISVVLQIAGVTLKVADLGKAKSDCTP